MTGPVSPDLGRGSSLRPAGLPKRAVCRRQCRRVTTRETARPAVRSRELMGRSQGGLAAAGLPMQEVRASQAHGHLGVMTEMDQLLLVIRRSATPAFGVVGALRPGR